MDIRSVRMTVRTFFVSVFVKMPAVYRHIMRMIMMQIIMRMNVIVSQLFMSVDMRMFFFYDHPHSGNHQNKCRIKRPCGYFMQYDNRKQYSGTAHKLAEAQ